MIIGAGAALSVYVSEVSSVSAKAVPLDVDQQRDYCSGVSAPVAGSIRNLRNTRIFEVRHGKLRAIRIDLDA